MWDAWRAGPPLWLDDNGRPAAACYNTWVDMTPSPPTGPFNREYLAKVAAAKAVCAECPVTGKCRKWALAEGEKHGVWGGFNLAAEHERRAARRLP